MQPAKATHGAFLARRKLAASGSSRAPCAFPNLRCDPRCWLFSCLGLWSHPHISPKEHQKERCGHFSAAALLHYFSWCALEYSVAGRISCYVSHDNTRTSVCQLPFAKKFLLLLLLNRIDSIPASEKAGHCDLRILRLKRIANTAGVRTHGEMSVSALRLYCSFCCWGIPTPLSC